MTDPLVLPRVLDGVRCPACGELFRWDFTAAPLRRVCGCVSSPGA